LVGYKISLFRKYQMCKDFTSSRGESIFSQGKPHRFALLAFYNQTHFFLAPLNSFTFNRAGSKSMAGKATPNSGFLTSRR